MNNQKGTDGTHVKFLKYEGYTVFFFENTGTAGTAGTAGSGGQQGADATPGMRCVRLALQRLAAEPPLLSP